MQPSSFLFSLSPSPETSPKLPVWGELNCFIQRLLVVGWGKSQPFIHLPFPTMNSSSDSTETPLAKKRLTMQRFCVCVCMLNHFSHVQLYEAIWDAAHQAPLSMEFSRQEYWSGLPRSSPRDLPDSGIEPTSCMSSALAGRFFTTGATWEPYYANVLPWEA